MTAVWSRCPVRLLEGSRAETLPLASASDRPGGDDLDAV